MKTIRDLIEETDKFFELHWNKIHGEKPNWSDVWKFEGPAPNKDSPGCYAFLSGKEVVYIGSAINKNYGIYEDCSLGARINSYIRWNREIPTATDKRIYKLAEEWGDKKIDSLITIPFKKTRYLVLALETYLIINIQPYYNKANKN